MNEKHLLNKLNLVMITAIISLTISLFFVMFLQKISYAMGIMALILLIIRYFIYRYNIKSNKYIINTNKNMNRIFIYSLIMPFLFMLLSYIPS
ncbi:hypothetical protein DY116_00525 [Apilactobacillus micheneri]|nr:hypothetical protein DY116_00525 [Apilactobacillus micheneri]TPR39059.1 hypothetical protein DY119_05195 [Apilactobacillus micheneri]